VANASVKSGCTADDSAAFASCEPLMRYTHRELGRGRLGGLTLAMPTIDAQFDAATSAVGRRPKQCGPASLFWAAQPMSGTASANCAFRALTVNLGVSIGPGLNVLNPDPRSLTSRARCGCRNAGRPWWRCRCVTEERLLPAVEPIRRPAAGAVAACLLNRNSVRGR